MIFTQTPLQGAHIISIEQKEDERGFFARLFCQEEFKQKGLEPVINQASISYNKKKATLRGMHMRVKGHEEAKLIRCSRGSIYDVIIDMRKEAPTYMQWFDTVLSAQSYIMLYVPKGFAHGYVTLEEDTELTYFISEPFMPGTETGYHWQDPAFNISWPIFPEVISERDNSYPYLTNNPKNKA